MKLPEIARVCHEVNRAYCLSLGDTSQLPWEEAPESIKESAIDGVCFVVANPSGSPASLHEAWFELKASQGWKYGMHKDETTKTHPCMVRFEDLRRSDQSKDYIFRAIVNSLKDI